VSQRSVRPWSSADGCFVGNWTILHRGNANGRKRREAEAYDLAGQLPVIARNRSFALLRWDGKVCPVADLQERVISGPTPSRIRVGLAGAVAGGGGALLHDPEAALDLAEEPAPEAVA
jgi:hypothetical protein